MTIRPATRADATAIAAVHVTSWRETFTQLLPQSQIERNTDERRRAFWERVLDEALRDIFVAAQHDAVVGFVCGGSMPTSIRGRGPVPGHDAYVDALYVLPAWHGRGIGRTLLGALARRLAERGLRSLALHVVTENPARTFYERLGARLVQAEPPAGGAGKDAGLAYGWSDITRVPTRTSVDGSTAGR